MFGGAERFAFAAAPPLGGTRVSEGRSVSRCGVCGFSQLIDTPLR
jgi:hypothetical protein